MNKLLVFFLILFYCLSILPNCYSDVIIPIENNELFPNPNMGWQTSYQFSDYDPSLNDIPSTSAYYRLYWCDIESEEGQINFALFDSLLLRAKNSGQKLCFRIMCAGTTDEYMYVPQWLKDKGCEGFEYHYRDQEKIHWIPDMNDSIFLEAHFRLINELGNRYDGHSDLDLIDIGSVGLWGEWHMAHTDIQLPNVETRIAIIDMYCQAFTETQKVVLIGDEIGLKYGIQNNCGWRADCLGDMCDHWSHMRDFYPQKILATNAENVWKTAPVAFESCWDMRKWKEEGWDIHYIFEYALNYHVSYFNNKSAPIPEDEIDTVKWFLLKIGYRLVLKRIEYPNPLLLNTLQDITMDWENIGVAPPYNDYFIAFKFTEIESNKNTILITNISIKNWLPGKIELNESIVLPDNLASGKYNFSLAIVDSITKLPMINFAIFGREEDGWYHIGQIEILN